MKQPQKKDDKLEVRLPQETKLAFMERCRRESRPASEKLRALIEAYLAEPLTAKHARAYARPALTLAASVALVLLVVVPLTPTQSPAASQETTFLDYDKNRDGAITVDEFLRKRMMKFPESDAPGAPQGRFMLADVSKPPAGAVSLSKSEAHDLATQILDGYDRNMDGVVSLDEYDERYRGALMNSFRYFDANFDRTLTLAEMTATLPPAPKPRIHFSKPTASQFASRDRNKDGALSEAEFISADWQLKDRP